MRSVAYVETPSDDQQRLIDFIWTIWTMKNWTGACVMMNITTKDLTCLKPEHLMMLHDTVMMLHDATLAIIAVMEPLTKPFLTVVDDDLGTRH